MASYFEEALEHYPDYDFYDFSYDFKEQHFLIGGAVLPLANVPLDQSTIPLWAIIDAVPDKLQLTTSTLRAAAIDPFHIITTPLVFDYLTTIEGKDELKVTRKVIADVFNTLMRTSEPSDVKGYAHGFDAGLLRPGHPRLATIGDCSCMGVSQFGHLVSPEDFGSKFAEYEFHNIFRSEQSVSLLAGLGHLALKSELHVQDSR